MMNAGVRRVPILKIQIKLQRLAQSPLSLTFLLGCTVDAKYFSARGKILDLCLGEFGCKIF